MIEGFGPRAARGRDARGDHVRPTGSIRTSSPCIDELRRRRSACPPMRAARRGRTTRSARRSHDRFGRELRERKQIARQGRPHRRGQGPARERIVAEFCPAGRRGRGHTPAQVKAAFHAVEEQVVRELILDGNRPDGRGLKRPPRRSPARSASCRARTARPSSSAARRRPWSPPRSAPAADEQRVDGLIDEYSKKFMLDYNFPPFTVGECRPIRGPGRREIGHGALAERSLKAGPARRPTSSPTRSASSRDILESNGSQLDGLGLRRHAGADGRRRADHATRSPASRSAWSRNGDQLRRC